VSKNILLSDFFKNERVRDVIEWILYLGAAIIFAILINRFVILNAHIPSSSMEKTIMTGDNLFVFRLSYLFSEPKRFDIVVFKFPDNENMLYIKRIIGMPGEKLEIKDGKVYINDSDEALDDSFINGKSLGDYGPYFIPNDSYFMMGDNRMNSQDSRFWYKSFLNKNKILGKAIFRYSPSFKILK
jgi:signal peptidase I